MKNSMKVVWLVIAVAFMVGAALMVTGFFAGASMGLYADSNGIHVANPGAETVTIKEEDLKGVSRIRINVDAADVKVAASDRSYAEIRATGGNPTVEIDGDVLRITEKRGLRGGFPIFNIGLDWRTASDVTVYIERGVVLDEVNVNSSFGDVKLNGFSAEKVTMRLSAGSVRGGDLKVGRLDIENSLGDVRMEGIAAEDTRIKLSAGDVDVTGDFGATQIENSLGDIKFRTSRPMRDYNCSITTDLGDVRINGERSGIATLAGGDIHLKLHTSLGSVNANFQK